MRGSRNEIKEKTKGGKNRPGNTKSWSEKENQTSWLEFFLVHAFLEKKAHEFCICSFVDEF